MRKAMRLAMPVAAAALAAPLRAQQQQVGDGGAAAAVAQAIFAAPPANAARWRNQAVAAGGGPARAVAAGGEAFDGCLTARAVRRAVDGAVRFLRSQQAADGSVEEYGRLGGGTSLAALALLAAGLDPVSDDALKRALEWLLKQDMNETYVRGIRANVWEYALRKCPYDERFRRALEADYRWLIEALGDKEGWRYRKEDTTWDNSVTQYGVLGVWAACRAGIDPGAAFWERMSGHFLRCQNADGGWGYQASGSTANMATAGLATMFLVFDMHHGRDFYARDRPRPFARGDAAQCLASIARCMEWLGRQGGSNRDSYYLYGIERTGVASGRKYIGGRDWFREGAEAALGSQQPSGQFAMQGHGGPRIGTAFTTLFLVYGGAPVAFNKLEYGENQEWNLNPRDLANLTRYLWAAYERPLNWHSVSLAAPADEFEAPILFISGHRAAVFGAEEVGRLRDYVERGGLILAEPSDGSPEFRAAMEALAAALYPPDGYPDRRLEPLAADHGIYTVLRQSWARRPALRGMSDGARTFFVLSDGYLSADWQMDRTDSDAFKLAMNLLFYATDLGELEGRFASVLPDTPPARPRESEAVVATAVHGAASEHPADWRSGAAVWTAFAPYFRHVNGARLVVRDPVALRAEALEGVQVLRIAGQHALCLSPGEQAALRGYVEGGGTVLVDAYAGAGAFAASARRQIEALFGPLAALDARHTLAAGRLPGGTDLARGIKLTLAARRDLRARGEPTQGQKLLAATLGGRPAVIFSEFDLGAAVAGIANYGARGYKPDSARRILGNLVGFAAAD